MSAFMVSDAHIDLLATAYAELIPIGDPFPQLVGETLIDANARSIVARYGVDRAGDAIAQAMGYRFQRWQGELEPTMISKQIACLDYQSCEADDWSQSVARMMLDHLLLQVGDNWSAGDNLPWGVDEHPAPEWSGSPDPTDPDNFWIDDATGERVDATTGQRSPPDAAVVIPLRLSSPLRPVYASQAPVDGLPLFDEDRSPRLL